MRISELANAAPSQTRLMALAQFLRQRARDEAVEPRISLAAFMKLAANLGIAVTAQQLKDLMQQPPLNGIIKDVTGATDGQDGEVIFRGAESDSEIDQADAIMTPDTARDTVDSMAKRAIDIQ